MKRQLKFCLLRTGEKRTISEIKEEKIEHARILEKSDLFDPLDGKTLIAYHEREYLIDRFGITVKQTVQWMVFEKTERSYMGMLSIKKRDEDAAMTDRIILNDEKSAREIPNPVKMFYSHVGKCRVFSSDHRIACNFSAAQRPDKENGQKRLLITDSGWKEGYNKIYYVVCLDGEVSKEETWTGENHYTFDMNFDDE